MNTVEIHRRRTLTIIVMGVFVLFVLPVNYTTFFTDSHSENLLWKFACVVIDIVLLYNMYNVIKTLRDNKPAIVLSVHVIQLNKNGKTIEFAWNEIERIYIEENDNTYELIIHANGTKKKFSLSFLDKDPQEINSLIKAYKK